MEYRVVRVSTTPAIDNARTGTRGVARSQWRLTEWLDMAGMDFSSRAGFPGLDGCPKTLAGDYRADGPFDRWRDERFLQKSYSLAPPSTTSLRFYGSR